jgi:hypothetical protein
VLWQAPKSKMTEIHILAQIALVIPVLTFAA